jgi:hypothetical protein
MIYETDTDMVAIWNGTAWRYISATTPTNGTVLQVVAMTPYSTETSSSTSTYVDTGISATITPKSASSKILILVSIAGVSKVNNTRCSLRLMRGGSQLIVLDQKAGDTQDASNNDVGSCGATHLDSPATTSATTYKVQFRSQGNVASVTVQTDGTCESTMILMEIAA